MNTNKISILFLLQKSKTNQQGKCPVRCRITFKGEREEFASGLFVNPSHWHSKQQIAKPPTEENTFTNTQLSLIKNKINQAFLFLQMNQVDFDVNDIYKTYKGEPTSKEIKVLENYSNYNLRIKSLVGKSLEKVTYNKYLESFNHLQDFIKFQFKSSDIKLSELKGNFLDNYQHYLSTEKGLNKQGLAQSTINKAIQRFRKTIQYALSEGYLKSDPFIMHKAKVEKKKVIFLSPEELSRLEKHDFQTQRVQNIKNLFVFCCYTGLAFNEMSKLKKADIFTGFDGHLWLTVSRSKTNRSYNVPLLPKAKNVIDLFEDKESEMVFPRISNQKFNEYLKEIADVLGIDKKLTHHIARKTFASTVLLYNDVPMEIVSELLGHSSMVVTQANYGKIVQNKISEQIKNLVKSLNDDN